MSVTLNDSLHTTVDVNAMIFGAGNVNLFAGSGPYFEDTNGDRFIDNTDTPNSNAVGLAIENANVALMLMSRVTAGGTGPTYKALKATASRIGLVGLESVTLSAADLKIEYNDVAKSANANDTTVVDFTRMDGGSYKADTGAGSLTFDYSQSRLLVEVGHAELSVASNVFIHGGLAFSKAAPQTVRLSNGTLKQVSGFDLGASDVAMFAGTNGPYWLDPTGTQLNTKAVGVSLQNTSVALSVLRPTASTDKTRYIGLSASSSFFGFVGFDAFALSASAIAVNLNIASGDGATSASPVIGFDATFPTQWTQNIVFDANKDGIVTVDDLRQRSGQDEFANGSHVLYTSQTSSTTPVTYAQLLAALDTGNGTDGAPDRLLQLDEIRAFLSSDNDHLADEADADDDGLLEFGYGISTGSGSEFLRESRRRINVSADNVLLNVSEFIYVNGNVAIDIGNRVKVTVNTGIPASLATLMGSEALHSLRSALSSFSSSLNDAESSMDAAFQSIVDEVEGQIESLCNRIADTLYDRLSDKLEDLQAAVQTLAADALELATSSLSEPFAQFVRNTLSSGFLHVATEEPLRSLVQSTITDPLEDLLQAAFTTMLQQALSEAIGPLVAGVPAAVQMLTDNLGRLEEQVKAAIVASLQPQVILIRSRLQGLKAGIDSRLAPVLDRLNQIAGITLGDSFSTLSGLETEVTTVGVSDARAFIGRPPAGGLDWTKPLNGQDAIGLFVDNFNLAVGIFKPTLSQSLPEFTAARMTIGEAGFTDGGADVLTLTVENVDVRVNTGKPLIAGAPVLRNATVDFPLSFPAEAPRQSGFAVATGTYTRPVYLDFTREIIEASVGNVTIALSDFIYLAGSVSLRKGGAQSVSVTDGPAAGLIKAGLDVLNITLPAAGSIPATGTSPRKLSFSPLEPPT